MPVPPFVLRVEGEVEVHRDEGPQPRLGLDPRRDDVEGRYARGEPEQPSIEDSAAELKTNADLRLPLELRGAGGRVPVVVLQVQIAPLPRHELALRFQPDAQMPGQRREKIVRVGRGAREIHVDGIVSDALAKPDPATSGHTKAVA